jgi:hypothetical protein
VLHAERRRIRLAVLQSDVPLELVRVPLLLSAPLSSKGTMSTRTSSLVASLALVCLAPMGCDSPPASVDAAMDLPDTFVPPDDAWTPPDAWTFVPAEHDATVIADQGGARLAHPQLVIITFSDDTNRASIEADAAWIVGSDWLTTVGAEYGIGHGSILANVRRTDAAPDTITTSDIETLLTNGIADHSLPTAADGTFDDVLYAIFFPEHTHISDPMLGDSCMAYGGYHYEAMAATGRFSYAVIPFCPHFTPSLTGMEFEQEAFSHELIEAATDALPTTSPAFEFARSGFSYSPWLFVGPELADLCALRVGPRASVREAGFVATRMWSNAAAAAGDRDPCIPADPTLPYYSVAVSPASVQFVAAGTTTTFDVVAWTTAPMPDFAVYTAPVGPATVTASLDRTTMNNGDHAMLTVTVPAGTPTDSYALVYVEYGTSGSEYDAQPVVVYVR